MMGLKRDEIRNQQSTVTAVFRKIELAVCCSDDLGPDFCARYMTLLRLASLCDILSLSYKCCGTILSRRDQWIGYMKLHTAPSFNSGSPIITALTPVLMLSHRKVSNHLSISKCRNRGVEI